MLIPRPEKWHAQPLAPRLVAHLHVRLSTAATGCVLLLAPRSGDHECWVAPAASSCGLRAVVCFSLVCNLQGVLGPSNSSQLSCSLPPPALPGPGSRKERPRARLRGDVAGPGGQPALSFGLANSWEAGNSRAAANSQLRAMLHRRGQEDVWHRVLERDTGHREWRMAGKLHRAGSSFQQQGLELVFVPVQPCGLPSLSPRFAEIASSSGLPDCARGSCRVFLLSKHFLWGPKTTGNFPAPAPAKRGC